jgi:hypothetical protein
MVNASVCIDIYQFLISTLLSFSPQQPHNASTRESVSKQHED